VNWFAIAGIGLGVGLLSGLFGKGGSAIATPLLHAVGVPALIAVAAPLPATIPSTLAASSAYWRARLVDRELLGWNLAIGIPATIVGAVATRWISGDVLLRVTDVLVAGLGVRFLCFPTPPATVARARGDQPERVVVVAAVAGLVAGLLANSGGFLLAPLYLAVLRLPIRSAFATSLAVSAVLAVPGTLVHWALGHIDWTVVVVFGAAAVPCSYLGARLALRTPTEVLERAYGAVLLTLGVAFLVG
jgi:uncharacterized membrane protein YfcA